MRFTATPLSGAFVIELDLLTDERGHFARTFDQSEFAEHGLDPAVVQCNTSYNARRGILRGRTLLGLLMPGHGCLHVTD